MINAFHPDFVKTHMPEFITAVKTEDRQSQAGKTLSGYVTEKRKTTPSHGQVTGVSKKQRETVPNQNFQDIAAFPKTRETQKSLRRGAKMTVAEVRQELVAVKKTKGDK